MLAELLLLISAIPLGFLISFLTRDELVQGRNWFQGIMFGSVLLSVFFLFLDMIYVSYTLTFVFIVSSISLIKSYDKEWIKIR